MDSYSYLLKQVQWGSKFWTHTTTELLLAQYLYLVVVNDTKSEILLRFWKLFMKFSNKKWENWIFRPVFDNQNVQ